MNKAKRTRVVAGGHLPLPMRTAVFTEIQVLITLSALQGGFFNEGMGLELSLFLIACSHTNLSKDESRATLSPAIAAMASIADRHTATGRWRMREEEEAILGAALPWLASRFVSLPRRDVAEAYLQAELTLLKKFDKL